MNFRSLSNQLIDSEKKAKAIGIQAFIMKPILRQVLAETIREVLDGTRQAPPTLISSHHSLLEFFL
jgi:DNA-binding NarL/FixJ family response regulator